jgi:hypothetical protein
MQKDNKSTSLRTKQLLPRDISESLGKLPPQALDMEEAVLGAVMLERQALEKIVHFLKPEHFYREAHGEIYQAALALREKSEPIDMRTVAAQLRKTGKLDLIGGNGLYIIADLTSKVSSAENIDTHARTILEMAIKREIIQVASKIHHDAYEDTTDPFELMDRSAEALEFIRKNATGETNEAKIKAMWQETLVTDEPPPETPIIVVDNITMGTLGNYGQVIGKKKSRKTLYLINLISEAIASGLVQPEEIVIFDTEQGRYHVYKIRHKIFLMTGKYVAVAFLRGKSPEERREYISATLKFWKTPIKLSIIDGIRDLMHDINDTVETTDLIKYLEFETNLHNLFIILVLHMNKNDKNPRGHIGTELLNKAQFTIELEKDEKTGVTTVKCESARDEAFEPFGLTHGPKPDSLPVIIGTPMNGTLVSKDERRQRLGEVFDDGPLPYKQVIEEIKTSFGVGANKAGQLLKEFQRIGWVMKSGNAKARDTVYKMIVSTEAPPEKKEVKALEPVPLFSDDDELPF